MGRRPIDTARKRNRLVLYVTDEERYVLVAELANLRGTSVEVETPKAVKLSPSNAAVKVSEGESAGSRTTVADR